MSCSARTLHPVPIAPELLVSDDGGVWRLQPGGWWKRLEPSAKTDRYLQVGVRGADGRWRTRYVHQLVLEAFHGPRPPGMVARHLNGDKQDNAASGLCWGTRQENAQDAVRHGKIRSGARHPAAKLTEAKVAEAREAAQQGVPVCVLAKKHGVSQSAMSAAIRGLTWGKPPCQTPDDGGTA